jgi:TonB-linked SusC/RagA family outer membrane protein
MISKFKILLTVLFLLQCFIEPFAQDTINLKNATVKFSNTKLTVKDALNELARLPAVSITYNTADDFLKLKIVFSSQSLNVQTALNEIREQAPVDIVFKVNRIEVKNRPLDDSYLLQGTVRNADTKDKLVAADIFIEGTTTGTVTDLQGNYSIRIKPGSYILVCSFMGFHQNRIPINLYQNQDLDIILEVKQHEIDEVKIAGMFREIEPLEKGRSIENIGAKIMSTLNTNDVNDALHGRIPGVWTTKVSGAPGDHNRIRIRGINSIFGSSDPLYVVDGMMIPIVNSKTLGISDLNSHDVNSITVLKDASSTALYGYLGGNGVILIETKKGGVKTQFNVEVKKGIQAFSKRYDLMDSEGFLTTIDSSDKLTGTHFLLYSKNNGTMPKYPHYLDSLGNPIGSDDYQSEVFRIGDVSEYQISGQGSLKNVDYYISGNYFNQNGIVTNSKYKKYTFTGNFSKEISKKLSLRFLYKGSHQENRNNLDNYLGNNVIFKGINYDPAYRYTPDSIRLQYDRLYYNFTRDEVWSSSNEILRTSFIAPEMLFKEQKKEKWENANSGNIVGDYKINNDLSAQASISLSFRNMTYTSSLPYYPQYLQSKEGAIILDQQYDLKYKKQLKNHSISAFIRYRDHRDNAYWNIDSINNIMNDGRPSYYDIYLRGSQSIYGESGSVIRSIRSTILNVNYNYKKKYFISIITNFDKLKEGHYVNRNDFFPSVALDWDLSKENILADCAWLNSLNLFLNWGQAGNYPLNSLSNDLYSTGLKYTSNNLVVPGVAISNLANHSILAERTTETNYGTRISMFRERIKLSGDYYVKQNSDILVQRAIPLYYGGGYFLDNVGEMRNSGLELSMELVPVSNNSFYWSTQAGFSSNNQYITKLNDGVPIKFTNPDILFPDFIFRENEPLGSITGYSYQGKYADLSQADLDSKKYVNDLGMAYLKGDTLIKFRLSDVNKTIIGNSLPDYTFNWINSFEFKNFSCEMFWYGVIGCDKFNATKASTYISGTNSEVRKIVLEKLKCLTDPIIYESSYFIENASFIRLKTLNFSYSPTKKIASRIGIKYTLSFENLITLTHYSGYDPESTIYTDNNFTDNAVDMGAYPNPRGTYFSVSLTF